MPFLTDLIRLIGLCAVRRVAVFDRIDRNRAHAQFVGGTERTDRDLASVSDQDFRNHR